MHKALGKGLGALIPTDALETKDKVVEIDIENIFPNKYQSRIKFDEKGLSELADSIRQRGLIQPIIVSPSQVGKYQLIAGERRWKAAKLAGYKRIPAIVRYVQEREMFEWSLIENIQREDLNPIEEGTAYERMMEEFHLTQEELAQHLGKKRSSVANIMRLLNLPEGIKDSIAQDKISPGHARAILSVKDDGKRKLLAQKVIKEHLTVRETEEMAAKFSLPAKRKVLGKRRRKGPEIQELEERLQGILGTKVEIKMADKRSGRFKGTLEIQFYSQEDLERISKIIST